MKERKRATKEVLYAETGPDNEPTLTVRPGEEFDLDATGFTSFQGGNSAMPTWFGGSEIGKHHRIVRIRDNWIEWDANLKLEAKPMLGFVGLAPARERYGNAWGGV